MNETHTPDMSKTLEGVIGLYVEAARQHHLDI